MDGASDPAPRGHDQAGSDRPRSVGAVQAPDDQRGPQARRGQVRHRVSEAQEPRSGRGEIAPAWGIVGGLAGAPRRVNVELEGREGRPVAVRGGGIMRSVVRVTYAAVAAGSLIGAVLLGVAAARTAAERQE